MRQTRQRYQTFRFAGQRRPSIRQARQRHQKIKHARQRQLTGRLMGPPGLRKEDSAAIWLGGAGPAREQDADSGAASIRPQPISNCPCEVRDSAAERPGKYYASMRWV